MLLYHKYNYTAHENVGRRVLLGQVSPLFYTVREQCPGGRGLECRMRRAAEDSKEGEERVANTNLFRVVSSSSSVVVNAIITYPRIED